MADFHPPTSDQITPPTLSADDIQRYYLLEIRAAEDRAIKAETQAARERGRAEALRAALEWLQGRLRPANETEAQS
jgi:hypothetical protein